MRAQSAISWLGLAVLARAASVICKLNPEVIMKSSKAHLALIPAIGIVTFMLSLWIGNSNNTVSFLGLSSDALAGTIVGLGIGAMLVLLRQRACKNS